MKEAELKQKLKDARDAVLKAKFAMLSIADEDEHHINDEFHIRKAHHYIQYKVLGISTLLESTNQLLNGLDQNLDKFK